MRVLLVGGNGFIGSHVQHELVRSAIDVRVLDAQAVAPDAMLTDVEYRVEPTICSGVLNDALDGVDTVVYLASTTVPATSNSDVADDISSNLIPLITTLDAMLRCGVSRIIYLSSGGAVYGVGDGSPLTESSPLDPICSYGVVKLAAEKYLHMYRHLYGMHPLILRPSNPYGPRQGKRGVQGFISTCMSRMMRGESIQIWGDGSVVRDYLYIDDLTRAILLGIKGNAEGILNIGSGIGYSLNEVLLTLSETTGLEAHIELLDGRDFDVPSMVLSASRAASVLGWTPAYSLESGIAAYWRWMRPDGSGESSSGIQESS